MSSKKQFYVFIAILAMLLVGFAAVSSQASSLVTQTWLPGDTIFSNSAFTSALPVFGPANPALPRVNALKNPILKITMKEIDQAVLPGLPATRVWAYETRNALTGKLLGPAHWPAVTIETERFIPTIAKYVNDLPQWDPTNTSTDSFNSNGLVQGLISVDQTIHWANPLGDTGMMICMDVDCETTPEDPCCKVYTGPIPTVVHNHGQEVFSEYDGGPEQWFTSDGMHQGIDYRTLDHPAGNEAIYLYNNAQEAGTTWIHDHALGATRTNVYSGMAAFWFIRALITEPRNLPSGPYEIELALQDRQFDTNGQLFFPDGSGTDADQSNLNGTPPNPGVHPFWIPEFAGDVMIINGAPWPYFQVEPRRYRFRLLDGSNARFYNLDFHAPTYVIGRDDAYLDTPAQVNTVLFAPGQRVDVIVDFTGLNGQTITVTNDAQVPYPEGLVPGDPGQVGLAQIMQFQVTLPLSGTDRSCNPASGQCNRPLIAKTVRLTDGNGNLAPRVKISKKRQLILKEVMGDGGPLEVLVNNTKWDGRNSPGIDQIFPGDGVSELPQVGSTELWEIINLTGDAHPMHTHLVQFQILNRQYFDPQYIDDWAAAFPADTTFNSECTGGVFCPGYGPPLAYDHVNADGAIGGNPPLENGTTNYLIGYSPVAPGPEENGWVDTAIVWPGQVLRIVARWAPTSTPVLLAKPGRNLYPFDPTKGPGYVWHCHIVDHEDNEMMRPYKVKKTPQPDI
jgi:spore coat protein A